MSNKKTRIVEVKCGVPKCGRSFKTVKGYNIHYTKMHLVHWGYSAYPIIVGETVNE